MPEIPLEELVNFDFEPLLCVVAGCGDDDIGGFADLVVGCGCLIFFHADYYPLRNVFGFAPARHSAGLKEPGGNDKSIALAMLRTPPGVVVLHANYMFASVLFALGPRTVEASARFRASSKRLGSLHRRFTGPFTRPAVWPSGSTLRKYHCDLCLSWPSRDCWSRVEALAVLALQRCAASWRGCFGGLPCFTCVQAAKATYLLDGVIQLSRCRERIYPLTCIGKKIRSCQDPARNFLFFPVHAS